MRLYPVLEVHAAERFVEAKRVASLAEPLLCQALGIQWVPPWSLGAQRGSWRAPGPGDAVLQPPATRNSSSEFSFLAGLSFQAVK